MGGRGRTGTVLRYGAKLDVQGNELAPFAAGQVVHWSPRPGRALFFDRSTHGTPEVIIPFQRPGVS